MLKFASQIAVEVGSIYSKGAIHNDLEHDNVLICSEGEGCTVAKVVNSAWSA